MAEQRDGAQAALWEPVAAAPELPATAVILSIAWQPAAWLYRWQVKHGDACCVENSPSHGGMPLPLRGLSAGRVVYLQ